MLSYRNRLLVYFELDFSVEYKPVYMWQLSKLFLIKTSRGILLPYDVYHKPE